ncbi:MAG: hypothetical protein HY762_01350 [Planctomycetes bacterium]|nr:hypothetical protein [Planctomycetota bacterium]
MPKIQVLINEVKTLVKRKQIMESFAPPNITGLVYYLKDETVTLDSAKVSLLGSEIELPVSYMQYKPFSSVIINNVICKEGSKINEDTSIKTIKEKEVIFLYKGEEMPVEFKMK